MDPDTSDADDFFEALAGRRPGGPGARALGEALQAQQRTLREAESATAADWTPDERQRMDALRERLVAAGAFRPVPAPPPAIGWGTRLRRLVFGEGGSPLRPAAFAAGLVLATLLVLRMGPETGPDPSTILRGAGTTTVTVADPQAAATALETALRTDGADVLLVPIDAQQWQLLVRSAPPAALEAVQRRLREAGFAVEGPPPYELTLRGPAR